MLRACPHPVRLYGQVASRGLATEVVGSVAAAERSLLETIKLLPLAIVLATFAVMGIEGCEESGGDSSYVLDTVEAGSDASPRIGDAASSCSEANACAKNGDCFAVACQCEGQQVQAPGSCVGGCCLSAYATCLLVCADAGTRGDSSTSDAAQDGGTDAAQDGGTDAAQDGGTDAAQDGGTDAAAPSG